MIPAQVGEPKPMSEEKKDRFSGSGHRYNLDDAFIHIDGKRHNVADLLRLVVEKLATKDE